MKRPTDTMLAERMAALARKAEPVRLDLGQGERLHIDRPLPFLCVHVRARGQPAAREIVSANSSYLIARTLASASPIIRLVALEMTEKFGGFLLLDIGELTRDELASDADYLPPFEVRLSGSADDGGLAARAAFVAAVEKTSARFRSPRLAVLDAKEDSAASLAKSLPGISTLTLRFAPIYRASGRKAVYPELQRRMVSKFVDAGLQAVAAHANATGSLAVETHRALGRRAFIDAVVRADRVVDEIARSFDFLLAVTPINSEHAWREFEASKFDKPPRFLYRPLAIELDREKRKLHSVALDRFEDPVLSGLYREKQQEMDLQLSMIGARETRRFVEFGRALYGPVEPTLLRTANDILDAARPTRRKPKDDGDDADCGFVERRAKTMIGAYARAYDGFKANVEIRSDLPPGMMVSGGQLLISRNTVMAKRRVDALLSHEVGVDLLTYYNGSAQGLKLFRSGLAGYEGIQEGLAVMAEYLVGGLTLARMRLIAARVVACANMLDGATFVENYQTLVKELGFRAPAAFNIALRVHRGGGLAKDAVYLRGLLELLAHLGAGGSLEPFWMGKIATSHFSIMQELAARGLLKAARLTPQFLDGEDAKSRLQEARKGITPLAMIEVD